MSHVEYKAYITEPTTKKRGFNHNRLNLRSLPAGPTRLELGTTRGTPYFRPPISQACRVSAAALLAVW